MYSKSFYISEKIGNNAFSFERRKNTKLFVPSLVKIDDFSEIKLLEENIKKITFEDFGFDGKLSTNFGLENFYEIEYFGKKIYLFDNHNHALYFWYLSQDEGIIKNNSTLYHIDEHADYREPETVLEKTDLQSIFNYTNFSDINVGNYIIPAEKEGLIGKTIQIRNTKNLEDYLENIGQTQGTAPTKNDVGVNLCVHPENNNIILNLDLDFFQPNLDFIDYDLKKKVILDIARKADIITVSTSPFFVDQKLAIKVFKDLFGE